MGGLQGMGSPSKLPAQPGSQEQDADLAELEGIASDPDYLELQAMGSAVSAEANGANQEVPVAGYNGPGADTLESVANFLPAAGGIGLGLLGGPTPAAIPMGMAGAAAGTAWKQIILQDILKRVPQQGAMERIEDMKGEAATVGLGTIAGMGMSQGVMKAVTSKWGQAALEKVAEKAAGPLAAVKATISKARDEIFEPVEKFLASKVTPLTGEEAGNSIKKQLVDGITGKFKGFVKAYGELDEVAANIPLNDVVNKSGKVTNSIRLNFTDKVRDEALDMPAGTYKMVKGYTDRFDQAVTGKDFTKVMTDLRTEATEAAKHAAKYSSNAVRDRAGALMKFADDAEAYYEDKIVGGLAKRIAAGKATPAEMEGFTKMMSAQANPTIAADPKNLMKYTKSVANDYLASKESVKQSYGQFRGLLEDIGDVVKVNPGKMGPRQFARALSEVPPDKLAERAFDPRNAGAMRLLRDDEAYKGVYDTIVKNKMSDIIAKNTGVDGVINYKGIATFIKDMPESSAELLLNNKEYGELLKAVNNPRLDLLNRKQTGIINKIVTEMASLGEFAKQGGKAMARNPSPIMPKTSNAVGQAGARGLGYIFGSGSGE